MRWLRRDVSGVYLESLPLPSCRLVVFHGWFVPSMNPALRKFCRKRLTASTPTRRGRMSFTSRRMSDLTFSMARVSFSASCGIFLKNVWWELNNVVDLQWYEP